MRLNTYESRALPDVFVTMPSAEASSILALVDRLRHLGLELVRDGYTPAQGGPECSFAALIATQIADHGYAVHGFDLAFAEGLAQ